MHPTLSPLERDRKVSLRDEDADAPKGLPEPSALLEQMALLGSRMEEMQQALAAEAKRALLVIFQGRDASGKDGIVRRVFTALGPATCSVTSFKRPTPAELAHDFLWRIHQAVPPHGWIGVFNRSHYEDVVTVRVQKLVPKDVWQKRFDQINEFERMLAENGVVILKFFLHVSKEEQRRRLEERLSDPKKNWKFEVGDLEVRDQWNDYTEAYEEALERCNTRWAPWYVVPANKKHARDLLVAQVVTTTMVNLGPQFPLAEEAVLRYRGKIR